MDLLPYCRPQNLVVYNTFLDDLARQNLVLIGEDHFNPRHTKNEQAIIRDLQRRGRIFLLAAEDIFSSDIYIPKVAALRRFYVDQIFQLPSDGQAMADSLGEVPEGILTIAIVGEEHTNRGGDRISVDKLVKRMREGIRCATVFQRENKTNPEIYRLQTAANQDYVLVGQLS